VKFKLDENLPAEAALVLRSAGHDALTVLDQQLGGKDDRTIIHICSQENRILITLDLDFADVTTYPPEKNQGIIVFRLERQDKQFVLDSLTRLLPNFEIEKVKGHLWIVEESRIRIREGK